MTPTLAALTVEATQQSPLSAPPASHGAFEDSAGLRALLTRLHATGDGAWRHDSEAAELMRFCSRRYAALAAKYGLGADDAAVAAFEAMRNPSARLAADPWAVVTTAVRITLIAEHRAQGLLTSTHRARRAQYNRFHDPERFSDRDTDVAAWHPNLQTPDPADAIPHDDEDYGAVGRAVEDAGVFLTLLGWDAATAHRAVDYLAARLATAGDRTRAYNALRRDPTVCALLDLPQLAWVGLIRVVIGHPDSDHIARRAGLLARLLTGEDLRTLLQDDDLVRATVTALAMLRQGLS